MRKRLISGLSVVVIAVAGAVGTRAADVELVRIQDRCDQATFPPEAGCQGSGGVTFSRFLDKLNPTDGGHPAWNFHFGKGHIDEGEPLRLENTGGEPHSFTEVSAFGTGVVPQLNAALPAGTPPAVPVGFGSLEEANGATILLPGGERTLMNLSPGTHHFQCLIHPWMRLDVEVRKK